MEENTIMLLKKNIIKIEKNNKENKSIVNFWEGGELDLFSINKIPHKYSNTKVPLYRFFFNNNNCSNFIDYEENIITRNNQYNITYKCINCNSIHKVTLNNILRKINRNIINCRICKEYEELKRNNQCNYMLNYHSSKNINKNNDNNIIIKQFSLLDKLNSDKIKFDDYDSEFKEHYFKRNMDNDEFEYIRNKILSIQNKKFPMTHDFTYISMCFY